MRAAMAVMLALVLALGSAMTTFADATPSHGHTHGAEHSLLDLTDDNPEHNHHLHMAAEMACSLSCIAVPASDMAPALNDDYSGARYALEDAGPVEGLPWVKDRPPRA